MTPVPVTTPDQTAEERRATIEKAELPKSISDLLDQAAIDSGDKCLLNFFDDGITRTYSEVRSASMQAGAALAELGIGKGTHVAVMLPNILEMPIIWLALARLGAVMVPVNIRYSPRELRYVIENSEATYLFIHNDLRSSISGEMTDAMPSDRIFFIGGNTDFWHANVSHADPGKCPVPATDLDDLMNIQFTSGTTGFPKGCMLSHRYWLTAGIVNAWRDGRRFRRILSVTPFTYMDPQWLLLMAMFQRATLFVGRRQSTSKFSKWLSQYKIEFCLFPEAVAKQPLAEHDNQNKVVRANIYGLRASAHAALEKRYGLIAREAFGMTEIGSGMFMPMEAVEMVGSGSCGRPSPFRETRIVDETGKDVADGEIGELLIKGPGIFQGYYRNAEATMQSLKDGWFHTGDLFHKDAIGNHFIVGRKKDMIRRSGENIACREVEGVLREIDEVVEAALIPVPDPIRGEEVKAYIVLRDGIKPNDEIIRGIFEFTGERLATFKIPRYLEFIPTMPHTTSLKIAKSELAAYRKDHRLGSFDRVDDVWR
ncbi:AMP-binding protein [Sneathiella chungangensis]|uniref:AMP-binding protein n=1 Tax=Sneathiella chungangensis TaxID=1418234 RepID=A0A845MCW7_9PROT|nr:AMP-binding protein [Sneathiella chungangensis]MZR20914.1 AMP-binding protein [Sneathiella chungangensis]